MLVDRICECTSTAADWTSAAVRVMCRSEGGIPPLVVLLESTDTKVQRAAAGALRTLAFKNEANKNQVGLSELSKVAGVPILPFPSCQGELSLLKTLIKRHRM